MAKKTITRRTLLKNSAIAAAGGAVYLNFPVKLFGGNTENKTKVILIRDEGVINDSRIVNKAVIRDMLDKAVRELTGYNETQTAWKSLIMPKDVVGIKSNVWGRLPTPLELENAIKNRVMEAGVPRDKISIRDRGLPDDPVFTKGTALINVRAMRTHDWSGVGSLIKNYITFTRKPWSYHPDTCADLATLWDLPMVKGKTRLNILVMLTPLFHGIGPH
ncbi:MAG: twin-arginine translocation signal domain-containing protein, partial [Bacteroidales bacterium]|nr:twin-arginine translocation signal domain-containing protein [Bacteroidales bacterium]